LNSGSNNFRIATSQAICLWGVLLSLTCK
jgi:hypothetical protein